MNENKQCEFCGEEVLCVAKKCKHCGSELQAASGSIAQIENRGADFGIALLAIPAAATMLIWFWVSGMNLFQSPGSTLTLIGMATILSTAALAAMEAARTGMQKDKAKGTHSPAAWFFIIALVWIVGYPSYLLKRKHAGLKSRLVPGLALALVFVASWSMMNGAIEHQKAVVRGDLDQAQRQLESLR